MSLKVSFLFEIRPKGIMFPITNQGRLVLVNLKIYLFINVKVTVTTKQRRHTGRGRERESSRSQIIDREKSLEYAPHA